ncbi:protein MFI [Apteryx mantelli]|uniref:Protein MFI n=1 Tax=Apteryx mantelli TaxID=2696672 RepID=A0ABM4DZU9_9AVES
MRLFQYYKELISFKGAGDPHLLMKCIDPREAELLDVAAGAFIKFRLGGISFPPNVYYKIFTHRPIVDMCANSPKDYTKPNPKQLLQERILGKIWKDDGSGWYKRIENNGWRLLSIRFWRTIDPVTDEGNKKAEEFHYSKMKRKQEIEKKRKKRKIEWMKKMKVQINELPAPPQSLPAGTKYYAGSLWVTTEDPTAAILIQRAAEGIVDAAKKEGSNNVMDWEVDEILRWTNALNYEEYISQWNKTATSNSSANCQGFQFVKSQHDIYELSQIPHHNLKRTASLSPLPKREADFTSRPNVTPANTPFL